MIDLLLTKFLLISACLCTVRKNYPIFPPFFIIFSSALTSATLFSPISKVDSSQRIDEYDQSTQAALRKIMFDQKQKNLGLQTSEEMEQENLMKIAKNLPNSPL